jgi:dTDP-4-dehydrorhamnose reductase
MTRLLLAGGCGFVGGNIAKMAQGSMDVVIGGRHHHQNLAHIPFQLLDITDRKQVLETINRVKPDFVVNAAAVSNIDFAEKNRELARKVNVAGAAYLAEGCMLHKAKYLYFSSDAVFDGREQHYREEDIPKPVNYYGETKAEAERVVLSTWAHSVVVRVSLVLGYPVTSGNAFYLSLEKHLKDGDEVAFSTEEYRTPVDILTLAEAALEFAVNDYQGIIHIGSTESVNRYELARKVAAAMGYDAGLIKSKKEETSVDRAPRHRNGIISVEKAKNVLKTDMLGIDETVRRSIYERQ